eukprot:scaffold3122_cov136-Isochrysis_galbana.AAC.7
MLGCGNWVAAVPLYPLPHRVGGNVSSSRSLRLPRLIPPPAEKAASLSSSNFLAFSAPREANEASNTKGGENSLATSSTESPFRIPD